jgi:hypothetical protein
MYRAYLEQSQIFVGIYWQRYGWVAPGMQVSGPEDEFRLAEGKPMLLYLKRPAPDIQPRLTAFLDGIRAAGAVSYRTFATPKELERLLADDLAVLLSESFAGATATAGPGEPAAEELPTGTVTFLLTDIEGSTRLWETVPEAMEVALERHDRLLAGVIGGHGGVVVTSRGEGDSFFAVFPGAVSAVEAAGACQLALGQEAWPAGLGCGCGWACTPGRPGPAAATASTTRRSTGMPGSRPPRTAGRCWSPRPRAIWWPAVWAAVLACGDWGSSGCAISASPSWSIS